MHITPQPTRKLCSTISQAGNFPKFSMGVGIPLPWNLPCSHFHCLLFSLAHIFSKLGALFISILLLFTSFWIVMCGWYFCGSFLELNTHFCTINSYSSVLLKLLAIRGIHGCCWWRVISWRWFATGKNLLHPRHSFISVLAQQHHTGLPRCQCGIARLNTRIVIKISQNSSRQQWCYVRHEQNKSSILHVSSFNNEVRYNNQILLRKVGLFIFEFYITPVVLVHKLDSVDVHGTCYWWICMLAIVWYQSLLLDLTTNGTVINLTIIVENKRGSVEMWCSPDITKISGIVDSNYFASSSVSHNVSTVYHIN